VIEISSLTVDYGKVRAVDALNLTVPRGEVFGVVGPNGAGKTSTLKVLAGLLLPTAGRVLINGMDVVSQRRDVQATIGYMVDFFGVYDYLTVTEYLQFFGGLYDIYGDRLERRIIELLDITGLAHKRTAMVRELSRGMKQRLYFAHALIHSPSLLILDEPASGLDPRGRSELMKTLQLLNEQQGQSIVISSHILDELEQLCTAVCIMERGSLVGVQELGTRSTPSEPNRRRVSLCVTQQDVERAIAFLRSRPDVTNVRSDAQQITFALPRNDVTEGTLVRDLVQADISVLLPAAPKDTLEEAFFSMTKGETT